MGQRSFPGVVDDQHIHRRLFVLRLQALLLLNGLGEGTGDLRFCRRWVSGIGEGRPLSRGQSSSKIEGCRDWREKDPRQRLRRNPEDGCRSNGGATRDAAGCKEFRAV